MNSRTHSLRFVHVYLVLVLWMARVVFGTWTTMEGSQAHLGSKYVWNGRADPSALHQCKIYLKSKNMEKLENRLKQSSNPHSSSYGQHMTKQEVDELTKDEEGHDVVNSYLDDKGIQVIKTGTDYITAEAAVSTWESALNTEFFVVHKEGKPIDRRLVRCHEYSLPERVAAHVAMVTNTVQLPVEISRGPRLVQHGGVRRTGTLSRPSQG